MKPLTLADVVRDKETNALFMVVGYLFGSDAYKVDIYYQTPVRGLVKSRRGIIPLKVAEAKKKAGAYDFWPKIKPEILSKIVGKYPTTHVQYAQ